jgi:hypothetical protein
MKKGVRPHRQGNRVNKIIRARERSSFRPSPDKGVERGRKRRTAPRPRNGPPVQRRPCRTGGVCGGGISFLHDLPPKTLLNPPLTGGKRGMNEVIMARERLSFRPSPDKGRIGGVCGGGISFLHDLLPQTPLNPPLTGGKRVGDRFLPPPQGFHAIAQPYRAGPPFPTEKRGNEQKEIHPC